MSTNIHDIKFDDLMHSTHINNILCKYVCTCVLRIHSKFFGTNAGVSIIV